MTRTKKMTAFAMTLFFVGASMALYAQVPQGNQPMQSPSMNQSPNTNQSPSQMQQPQSQQPSMDQQMPQNQTQGQAPNLNLNQSKTTKVSDAELNKFATAYKKVQDQGQKEQEKMVAVIEKDGMKLDRFNEMQTAKMQNKKVDASKEEQASFKKITTELDTMEPDIQKEMKSAIVSTGFTVDRFQAIVSALQSDTDLQSRLQKLLGGQPKS